MTRTLLSLFHWEQKVLRDGSKVQHQLNILWMLSQHWFPPTYTLRVRTHNQNWRPSEMTLDLRQDVGPPSSLVWLSSQTGRQLSIGTRSHMTFGTMSFWRLVLTERPSSLYQTFNSHLRTHQAQLLLFVATSCPTELRISPRARIAFALRTTCGKMCWIGWDVNSLCGFTPSHIRSWWVFGIKLGFSNYISLQCSWLNNRHYIARHQIRDHGICSLSASCHVNRSTLFQMSTRHPPKKRPAPGRSQEVQFHMKTTRRGRKIAMIPVSDLESPARSSPFSTPSGSRLAGAHTSHIGNIVPLDYGLPVDGGAVGDDTPIVVQVGALSQRKPGTVSSYDSWDIFLLTNYPISVTERFSPGVDPISR